MKRVRHNGMYYWAPSRRPGECRHAGHARGGVLVACAGSAGPSLRRRGRGRALPGRLRPWEAGALGEDAYGLFEVEEAMTRICEPGRHPGRRLRLPPHAGHPQRGAARRRRRRDHARQPAWRSWSRLVMSSPPVFDSVEPVGNLQSRMPPVDSSEDTQTVAIYGFTNGTAQYLHGQLPGERSG